MMVDEEVKKRGEEKKKEKRERHKQRRLKIPTYLAVAAVRRSLLLFTQAKRCIGSREASHWPNKGKRSCALQPTTA